jgi:hypothetical protein
MQPRRLVFALLAASVWTGLAGPLSRTTGTQFSASFLSTAYQRAQDSANVASPLACSSLEDDAADDLRCSLFDTPAVSHTLQPCAGSEALQSFAAVYLCSRTLESQHIVLQI